MIISPVYGKKVVNDLSVLLNQEYDIDPQIFGYIASMIENLIKMGIDFINMVIKGFEFSDNTQQSMQWKNKLKQFSFEKRLLVFLTLDFAEDIVNNQWHDKSLYEVPVSPATIL